MVSMAIAKIVGDLFTMPFYEANIASKCIPFLETDTTPDMDEISCRDVMHKPVVVLQQEDTLENMIQTLETYKHNAFPVVNSEGFMVGIIRRKDLLLLMERKVYKTGKDFPPNEFQALRMDAEVDTHAIRQQTPADELGYHFHLRKYLHQSPMVVREHFSLSTAYVMFRTLGLRHLTVVDFFNRPRGMITRQDLLEPLIADIAHRHAGSIKKSFDSFHGRLRSSSGSLRGGFSFGTMSLTSTEEPAPPAPLSHMYPVGTVLGSTGQGQGGAATPPPPLSPVSPPNRTTPHNPHEEGDARE